MAGEESPQGFDTQEKSFSPLSETDIEADFFKRADEMNAEQGEGFGGAQAEEPRRVPGMDKTQVQAGYAEQEQESMVNQEAIAAENARMEEELQWQEAMQDEATLQAGQDDAPVNTDEAGKPARESKTSSAFLAGTIMTMIFPPYGVYRLMKPYIATDPIHASIIIASLPPIEMVISAFMLKNVLKYTDEYAPYPEGKKTMASAFMGTVPWIWWSIVLSCVALMAIMIILVTICGSGSIAGAVCWWYDVPTGITP